jgi:mono/diheme cytochrome c family protein
MAHHKQALAAAFGLTVFAGVTMAQPDGAALYADNCSGCHQLTGKGIPGAFPSLAGDPFVVGRPEPVASTVLNGRGGMPTFGKDLADDEIAAILTFVRSSWGNHGAAIDAAIVKAERNGGNQLQKAAPIQAH